MRKRMSFSLLVVGLAISDLKLTGVIKEFRHMGVQKVAPSHCSGDRCRELFKEEYSEDYIESGVGRIIAF